jgi:DNA-binding transcriptional LysR family regulator
MKRDQLGELGSFVAVAEERSFRRAAARLSVTPSALSHAMRALEQKVGLRLLARTTRSVALTEAGQRLLARVRPALEEIEGAYDELRPLRSRPSGRLRVRSARHAAMRWVAPVLGRFARENPDVTLELVTDDSQADLVSEGFDAGITLGEFMARGMKGVRISADLRAAIVGAPSYFADHPRPRHPRDLHDHLCINFRHGGLHGDVYRWEFQRGRREVTVAVKGPLVLDDSELVLRAARDGAGLAFLVEEHVADDLSAGRLLRVLEDWCPAWPGYYLYHPTRRHMSPALTALIGALQVGEGAG